MSGFSNDVVYGKNADYTAADNQSVSESNGLVTDSQMWIGSTATNAGGTHINVGTLTSPDSSITFGYSSPNITAQVAGGTTSVTTLTPDTGGAVTPVGGTIDVLGQTSGSAQSMETINTANELFIVDRTFVTPYVVDASATPGLQGTFTTIQAAVNAVIADSAALTHTADILIRPGTYAGNVSFSDASGSYNFISTNPSGISNSNSNGTIISGTFTATCSELTLTNIKFENTVTTTNANTSINNCFVSTFNPGSSTINLASDSILGTCTLTSGSFSINNSSVTSAVLSGTSFTGFNSIISSIDLGASVGSLGTFTNCNISTITGTTAQPINLIDCNYSGATGAINPTCTINYGGLVNTVTTVGNPFGTNPTLVHLKEFQGNMLQSTRTAISYTVKSTDYYVAGAGRAAGITLTLPDTSSSTLRPGTNQTFIFADEDGNAVANPITIATNGGTINGGASVVINRAYETMTVVFNGTNYFASSSANLVLPLTVPNGGTGLASTTAYALLAGGTTSTGALQSIASVGTANQVLLSNGAGALPTFQTVFPASSTDNALARWDSTTGKVLQNGVITEDDTGNLSITASVSGGSLSATVSNTSNTASATAHFDAIVAGGTASDAYFSSTVTGGQAWTWGVDNSDSDAFALSANASLGTTNVMRVSTAGEINYPLTPCFFAFLSAGVTNTTGNGTQYNLIADTEVFDQNADYNNATGVFTAPVTGRYLLGGSLFTSNFSAGHTSEYVNLFTSNRTITLYAQSPLANVAVVDGSLRITGSVLCDMDAGDTAYINTAVFGSTQTVTVAGNPTDAYSSFWGKLEA